MAKCPAISSQWVCLHFSPLEEYMKSLWTEEMQPRGHEAWRASEGWMPSGLRGRIGEMWGEGVENRYKFNSINPSMK